MIFAQTLGLKIKSIYIKWLSKRKRKMNYKFITEASICFKFIFKFLLKKWAYGWLMFCLRRKHMSNKCIWFKKNLSHVTKSFTPYIFQHNSVWVMWLPKGLVICSWQKLHLHHFQSGILLALLLEPEPVWSFTIHICSWRS